MKSVLQKVPQVSVNDEYVILVGWRKNQGEYVKANTVICEVETSKALMEIEAEDDGYLFHLVEQGAMVDVGKPIALVAERYEPDVVARLVTASGEQESSMPAPEKKWTKKAELLARKHGVDIVDVVAVGTVREEDVLRYLGTLWGPDAASKGAASDGTAGFRERIIVIGGGFGAAHIIDAIERSERQTVVGIVDDNPDLHGKYVSGFKVLGPVCLLDQLRDAGVFDSLVISLGDIRRRRDFFGALTRKGMRFANVIDIAAQIHSRVSMGTGNVILAKARVATYTVIGNNNFLSGFVNLDHHNVLGSNCTFGPGVMTSGRVIIGDNVRFGTGIFVEPGVRIGTDSIIASGVVITRDIPEDSIVKKLIDYKVHKIAFDERASKG